MAKAKINKTAKFAVAAPGMNLYKTQPAIADNVDRKLLRVRIADLALVPTVGIV